MKYNKYYFIFRGQEMNSGEAMNRNEIPDRYIE